MTFSLPSPLSLLKFLNNRSQMTSNCGKNKKVAHEAKSECATVEQTSYLDYFSPAARDFEAFNSGSGVGLF